MPEKQTLERLRRDRREGKAPSTQAGEFIRKRSPKSSSGIRPAGVSIASTKELSGR
jgi:hypothetical protein